MSQQCYLLNLTLSILSPQLTPYDWLPSLCRSPHTFLRINLGNTYIYLANSTMPLQKLQIYFRIAFQIKNRKPEQFHQTVPTLGNSYFLLFYTIVFLHSDISIFQHLECMLNILSILRNKSSFSPLIFPFCQYWLPFLKNKFH